MITELLHDAARPFMDVDLWVVRELNSLAGNRIIDGFVGFVCGSRLLRGTVPMAIYWFLWFAVTSHRQSARRAVVATGCCATLVAIVGARTIAHLLPDRARPFADPETGFQPVFDVTKGDFEDWTSAFASDTAAFEFALAWSLLRTCPGCAKFLMVYGLLIGCLPRIYIGLHFPSDIYVGAFTGMAAAVLVQRPIVLRTFENAINRYGSSPLFYAVAFAFTCELAQLFDNVRLARKAVMELMRQTTLEPGEIIALVVLCFIGATVLIVALLALRSLARSSTSNDTRSLSDP
jgi:undecaprenyl-diphosphatase